MICTTFFITQLACAKNVGNSKSTQTGITKVCWNAHVPFSAAHLKPCNNTSSLFLIKPTDALISQNLFCQETLHVSGRSSAHHQDFSTAHSALAYIMQV